MNRFNKYFINRNGSVIRLNEDGSTNVLGWKAQATALLITNSITLALIAYGYMQGKKVAEQDAAIEASMKNLSDPNPTIKIPTFDALTRTLVTDD